MPYMGAEMGAGMMGSAGYWSMRQYLDANKNTDKKSREDDGLEKSIIVNIADDCTMGVKSGSVNIVITKKFEEKGFDTSA
jgi:hypothetical protein